MLMKPLAFGRRETLRRFVFRSTYTPTRTVLMTPNTRFYPIDAPCAYPEAVGTDDQIEVSDGSLYVHLNGRRTKLIGVQSLDFLIEQLVAIGAEIKPMPRTDQPRLGAITPATEEPNYRRLYAEYALAMAYINESLGITGEDLHLSNGIAPALREIFRLKSAAGVESGERH
ncbi:hypothetical protein [Pseudomonas syringae]|uniref:hypothetical protein n=2 Tax=Pseudomonas syringae group TaxID=136849 RepID=UPI000B01F01F|nr:hypothetical protein [Pseudomonas syringae]